MNYSWRIKKLGLSDSLNENNVLLENAIVKVQWKRIAEDTDGTSASYLGYTVLDATNVSLSDFIAVNDVTKEQVIAWVENSMAGEEISRIDAQLNTRVEKSRLLTITPSWN